MRSGRFSAHKHKLAMRACLACYANSSSATPAVKPQGTEVTQRKEEAQKDRMRKRDKNMERKKERRGKTRRERQ